MKDDTLMKAGQFLGLGFDDGYYFFRIMRTETTNLKPYQIESALAAAATSTSWNTIPNSASDTREQIQPTKEHKDQIYQIMYGVSPSRAQIYYQYISREDRGSLVGTRAEGGAVGHVDGEESPYQEPNEFTSLFTLYERSPVFKAYNPTPSTIAMDLNFKIQKMNYALVTYGGKGKPIIDEIMNAKRRCTFSAMGLPGETPITAPTWLTNLTKGIKFEDLR